MWRWLFLVLGVLGIYVGVGFMLPAVAQLKIQGTLPGLSVALMALGLVLTLGGLALAGFGIKAFCTRSS
jgi:hypothetical protein